MKYQSIFIANLAELAIPLAKLMTQSRREEEIFEDHALCDRFLFSDEDNRILITPFPTDQKYVSDTLKLLKINNLQILSPKQVKESVSEAILTDGELLEKLKKVIKENPEISLISYAATIEFTNLVNTLKSQGLSFQTPELPLPENRWTSAYFGSKAGFREGVSFIKNSLEMPSGTICSREEDVIGWANYFLKNKNGCVLKTNRGLAGAGIKIIKKDEPVNLQKILKSEPYWQQELVVVEELVDIDTSIAGGNPDVEFKIRDGKISPLYFCGMRVTSEGVFRGVEIGKSAAPQEMIDSLFSFGQKWAELLLVNGYQGFFDVDCAYGKDKKTYLLESNVRRTGGTHVYELGKRLLGEDFAKNYYLAANNMYFQENLKGKSYQEIKEKVSPVLFPINSQNEGIVLTGVSYLTKGYLGYVVIAKDKSRVAEIEEEFLKLI